VVDFGKHTYSCSKTAAELGRVTDRDEAAAARLHAMWLSNNLKLAGAEHGGNSENNSDDSDGDAGSRTTERNDLQGESDIRTGSTVRARQAQRQRAREPHPSGLCCR
jgi:hypothetical protein